LGWVHLPTIVEPSPDFKYSSPLQAVASVYIAAYQRADVAELADALDSKFGFTLFSPLSPTFADHHCMPAFIV
jgi:hypothetical protein